MSPARMSPKTRFLIAAMALVVASAIASTWRMAPDTARRQGTLINLVPRMLHVAPPIFTPVFAQIPVTTGCKGTPKQNDPDLGPCPGGDCPDGVLAIAMNSMSIQDYGEDGVKGDPDGAGPNQSDDPAVVTLLDTPKDLNFANTSGVNVGDFVNKPGIPIGTYEEISGVNDDQFRIKCAVPCPGSGGTFLTKGGTTPGQAPFDTVGGTAIESQLDINGGQGDQAFTFVFSDIGAPALEVTANGIASKNFTFSATGGCELWNLGGGNFQILPVVQSADVE